MPQFLNNINLNSNELQNALIHILAADPTPSEAQLWYNSTSKRLKYYDGTTTYTIANLADITGTLTFQGTYDASTNTPDLDTAPSGILKGYYYIVSADGTFFTEQVRTGDSLYALQDAPTTLAHWGVIQGNVDLATETKAGIAELATQVETDAGSDDARIVTPLKLTTFVANKALTKKYTITGQSIGTSPGTLTVTHNLNSKSVTVSVIDQANDEEVHPDIIHATVNTVTVSANGATRTVTVTVIG